MMTRILEWFRITFRCGHSQELNQFPSELPQEGQTYWCYTCRADRVVTKVERVA